MGGDGSGNGPEVKLPQQLVDLYDRAKRSFVFLEDHTGKWDSSSMPQFREALNHIVEATRGDPDNRFGHVRIAIEHLGVIACDTVNAISGRRLIEAQELHKKRWWRGFFRRLISSQDVTGRIDEIKALLTQARLAKSSATPEGWIQAADQFENAYIKADVLHNLLSDAPFRFRLLSLVAYSLFIAVVGSIIGGFIVLAFA